MSDDDYPTLRSDTASLDPRDIYVAIRRRIARRFFATPTITSRLSTIATQHFLNITTSADQAVLPQRVLLYGPSGSGKSTAARAIAESLSVPFDEISVTGMMEVGFKGMDILDTLRGLYLRVGSDLTRAERAVVFIDELCKAAVRDDRDVVGTSVSLGKQNALLPLFSDDGEVRFALETAGHPGVTIRTRRILIIAAGVFAGVPPDASTSDLIGFGVTRELSSRIGIRIALPGPTSSVLLSIYESHVDALRNRFGAFGYALDVPSATLQFIASTVAREGSEAQSRDGAAWLAEAAQAALIRLLDSGAATGTTVVIGPDDVRGALHASRARQRGRG